MCDVLDAAVLALRELTTVGHQHQLCSEMGIPTGSITKYLATAKATLLRVMRAHPAARVGFFEDQQMGYAAHRALEEQHYKCPVMGVWYALSIDGTIHHADLRARGPGACAHLLCGQQARTRREHRDPRVAAGPHPRLPPLPAWQHARWPRRAAHFRVAL